MNDRIQYGGDYIVHYSFDGWMRFSVYPIVVYLNGPSKPRGIAYIDKKNEPQTSYFKEGEALMKMQGSYCWRGVWEGRLYFTDEEYWGSDLKELSDLFTNHIEPHCKAYIKSVNPYEITEP